MEDIIEAIMDNGVFDRSWLSYGMPVLAGGYDDHATMRMLKKHFCCCSDVIIVPVSSNKLNPNHHYRREGKETLSPFNHNVLYYSGYSYHNNGLHLLGRFRHNAYFVVSRVKKNKKKLVHLGIFHYCL